MARIASVLQGVLSSVLYGDAASASSPLSINLPQSPDFASDSPVGSLVGTFQPTLGGPERPNIIRIFTNNPTTDLHVGDLVGTLGA